MERYRFDKRGGTGYRHEGVICRETDERTSAKQAGHRNVSVNRMGPMQLTRAGEYGILGTLYLAERHDEPVVMLAQIAEAEGAPESFLRKIFGMLAKHGIVEAQRGRHGGFHLARAPDQISLLEVIEAIEGPIALNVCLLRPESCDKRDDCPVHHVWEEAQGALLSVLDKHSLGDLAARRAARRKEKQT